MIVFLGCGGGESGGNESTIEEPDAINVNLNAEENIAHISRNGEKYSIDVSADENCAIDVSSIDIKEESEVVQTNKPSNYSFPDGLMSFVIKDLASEGGTTISVKLEFPTSYSSDAKYYKVTDTGFEEYTNAVIDGNIVTLTLTDGGSGDTDSILGQITDPSGPGEFDGGPVENEVTWYRDDDSDGYGNPEFSIKTPPTAEPEGYVEYNTDCNDNDGSIHPGAVEVCDDTKDNDCDGASDCGDSDCTDDDACQVCTDADADFYYVESECGAVVDCNDSDGTVNPGVTEACDDSKDNDCDGNTDCDDSDCSCSAWYVDDDSDGYGYSANSIEAVSQPSGYVDNHSDCNDSDENINPGIKEVCDNSKDDDCDGNSDCSDGDCSDSFVCKVCTDSDSDTYYVEIGCGTAADCNDDDGDTNPVASEVCDDSKDNDCDGDIDCDDSNCSCLIWFFDNDSDGYGDPDSSTEATSQPTGYVDNSSDCNDNDENTHPEATELCNDNKDNNCNGYSDCRDADCVGNIACSYTNSVGMIFNLIPHGTFTMGSPDGESEYPIGSGETPNAEEYRDSDETAHLVTLTNSFFMQTTEVTQGQWDSVMESNPAHFSICGTDCPVESISWDNIQTFLSIMNDMGGGTYRLPTEAEWEYAARSGSITAIANGEITAVECNYDTNLNALGWYCHNANNTTHAVAEKTSNAWGLYDMHGNVWEWCQDWYTEYPSGPVSDPTGPDSGSDRVRRGGSWNYDSINTRSAIRSHWEPYLLNNHTGFRLIYEPLTERQALIELYNSTDGDNWLNNTSWKTPPLDIDGFALPGTEGLWHGVVVVSDNVTTLSLQSNQLSGNIPPGLGNLNNLETLNLKDNQLFGSIPAELGNLANLTVLDLDNNELSGTIPVELANLPNLNILFIGNNQLTGSIPIELGNLSNLTELRLRLNQLSGTIPVELTNLFNLTYLSLWGNSLSGAIPPEIGDLSNLSELFIDNNQLSGIIPPELGNLTNLKILWLGNNQLTGSIPVELENLSNLMELRLWGNPLSGSIPVELGNLSNLIHLDLRNDQLSGNIPAELGNLPNLTILTLGSNQLSGTIPVGLGDLSNLTELGLNNNQLSGAIPAGLGDLNNLELLFLENNQLTGIIPTELMNLSNLTELKLSNNHLCTTDQDLINFLDSVDTSWRVGQTSTLCE